MRRKVRLWCPIEDAKQCPYFYSNDVLNKIIDFLGVTNRPKCKHPARAFEGELSMCKCKYNKFDDIYEIQPDCPLQDWDEADNDELELEELGIRITDVETKLSIIDQIRKRLEKVKSGRSGQNKPEEVPENEP